MKFNYIFLFLVVFCACNNTKSSKTFTDPIQSFNVAQARLLTVNNRVVLVIADQKAPTKVARYYVLQGAKTAELAIPKSILNDSNDFVSLQAGSKFWVLTLSESDRYKNLLTKDADTKILKGFGLAKYQESGLDFDTFIAELKAGKHDAKFK